MNLVKKTIHGVYWTGVSQYSRLMFSLVVTAILARLLAPKEFGLIAMVVVFTNFISLFKDFGLSQAIIQSKNPTQGQLSTSFWMNVMAGSILCLVMVLAAKIISLFYNEPKLLLVTMALAPNYLIASFGIVHSTILNKEMKFKKLAGIEILTSGIAGIAAIVMAIMGFGVWSLVNQQIIYCSLSVISLWATTNWKPEYVFEWNEMKGLIGFGLNLTGFRFVNYFNRNFDNLLIGKYLGAASLGIYSIAYRLLTLPLHQISDVLGKVMFPSFSIMQDDKAAVRKGFLKMARYISIITFPMMIGLLVLAPEFVRVVFGAKWERAIFIIQIFSLIGLLQSIGHTNGWIYLSQGRTDIQFRWGIFSFLLIVPSFIIGLRWDVEGVAVAYALVSLLLSFPNYFISFGLIDLKTKDFFRQLKQPLLFSVIMGGIIMIGKYILQQYMAANGFVVLICGILLGIVSYAGLIIMFGENIIKEFIDLISKAELPGIRSLHTDKILSANKRLSCHVKTMIKALILKWGIKITAIRRPLKIEIGALSVRNNGWIPTQIEQLNLLHPQDWEKYFNERSIDAILAEHVWEHLTKEEAMTAANHSYRYLKKGGYLRVAVPDGFNPNQEYLDWVKPGGTGDGAKDHKVLYNYKTFKEIFESVGFKVKMLEYYDETGEFHFEEWHPDEGPIKRSKRYDKRNKDGKLNYTSLILDAIKTSK
jgi:PST family polysaccharide transporter